jgi:glycosyltransferase involved in cell wall biosynthesis
MQSQATATLDAPTPTKTIRVAAFTGGESVPSRRFRLHQYLPHLEGLGIHVTEFNARFGCYPPRKKILWPLWLPATLADRIPGVVRSHQYDVTFLQREMVSTLLTLERFTHRPRLLDLDDAVWLNRGAEKNFASLVQMCDGVICGNNFIAETVRQWNNELIVLPTGVDTDRYRPDVTKPKSKQVIGWSGLGSGLKYLLGIEDALAEVLKKHKSAVLRVVSDVEPAFRRIDSSQVEFVRWSVENEVETVQKMRVGLMPIDDSLWSRGKCSYKMLLYMACGVPVVVSPVGMNNEVLALANVGFGPRSEQDWIDTISWLLDNPENAAQMGAAGRKTVEEHFSLDVLSPRLAEYLKRLAGGE